MFTDVYEFCHWQLFWYVLCSIFEFSIRFSRVLNVPNSLIELSAADQMPKGCKTTKQRFSQNKFWAHRRADSK